MKFFKRIIILCVIVVDIGVYYLFNQSTFMDGYRLDYQLSKLIKQQDASQLKKIAGDNDTYNFLMNLSKNTKPKKTSGNQGSSAKSEYYVTVLDHQKVDVLLKQTYDYGGLIKKVKVSQIFLQN